MLEWRRTQETFVLRLSTYGDILWRARNQEAAQGKKGKDYEEDEDENNEDL